MSLLKVLTSIPPCHSQPCGVNTVCREKYNRTVCSCLPRYIGNPLYGCQKPHCDPARCHSNEECRIDEEGFTVCRCKPGYIQHSFSFGCVQCETKFDCESNQICNKRKLCVDPCLRRGVCGPNDDCYVFNHKASCRPKSVHPTCSSDTDCPSHEACDGYKCVDPCLGLCSRKKANCQVEYHKPNCTCKRGFRGSPYKFCHSDCVD